MSSSFPGLSSETLIQYWPCRVVTGATLLVTSATLVVTGALLVETKSYLGNTSFLHKLTLKASTQGFVLETKRDQKHVAHAHMLLKLWQKPPINILRDGFFHVLLFHSSARNSLEVSSDISGCLFSFPGPIARCNDGSHTVTYIYIYAIALGAELAMLVCCIFG